MMVDSTTRWPEAIAVADATADTILQAFLKGWVARFGIPKVVTYVKGAQFTSQAWSSLLAQLGISVSTTTVYHPQSNSLVERFHHSFKNTLGCVVSAKKSWMRSSPWILLGLRNTLRWDTATSAAEVMYGTPLRVPILCFKQDVAPPTTVSQQLQLARSNMNNYLPPALDTKKFHHSPLIAKGLLDCKYVYLWDTSKAATGAKVLRPLPGNQQGMGK